MVSGSTSRRNKSQTTLSQSTALLPEIWLLVFPYLKHADLQTISLTCSTFRYMAQPLLFSVLDVSPFLLSYNTEQPILRPAEYLDRFMQRLEYYKLPHIAHGVRHCWISPYSRSGFPTRNQDDSLDPNLIIDAAIEALPRFTNLSTLSWHCIDIAPRWWDVIQSLRISRLWLNSSSIPHEVQSPLQHILHLDLDQWPWEGKVTNHVSIHEERVRGVNTVALHHVIHPEVIQSISVPRVDTACHLYSILSRATYPLRSLKVPFSSISDPSFITALENCPCLSSLCIFPPSSDERSRDVAVQALTASVLPSLESYEGPYSHVLRFSQQPLQNVALWGFDERPEVCDPHKLANVLASLAHTTAADSLKMLKFTVLEITSSLLGLLVSFKNMERLIMVSTDNTSRDTIVPVPQSFKSGTPVSVSRNLVL
ncbi:hypothetical protein CPC08DRAFT_764029 [Agrocybe pediades]|nr:hypothetical protein CPC08DRAFT_764029 [Agrocybe pediades]